MNVLRGWLFQGKFGRVLLEALLLALLALLLVLAVVEDVPRINLPATFFFLTQIPVGWAALRLKPANLQPGAAKPPRNRFRQSITHELAFAAALRLGVFLAAWYLAEAFRAQGFIDWLRFSYALDLAVHTACFFPYLLYRLFLLLLAEWQKLAQKSLLWMMVNSHLVTVLSLIALATFGMSFVAQLDSASAREPAGWLARIVLGFVRSFVPWVGVSVLFSLFVLSIFFIPSLLASYLASRRFAARIRALAGAMARLRQGDLGARVTPAGQDEIAQLQADFNHMAAELQEEREKVTALLKNQRELSAIVSHELRTPISVMRAYLENDLARDPAALPEPYHKDLETLHHETLKLQGLVEDLFTLSQLDQRRFELECAWVDVAAAVARIALPLQKMAWENKRIDLSTHLPPALPLAWADERRLEQVLTNLVQNAVRHTPRGGAILLQAEPAGGQVEIRVLDSGEGISPEDLPHIWDRFYRSARGGGAGRTGIGLSLVKELVENMGGTVGVESRPAEGSRFWLRLRAAPPAS